MGGIVSFPGGLAGRRAILGASAGGKRLSRGRPFFLLSGYVIALNYNSWFVREPAEVGQYLRFLALRLSRVYPVHLFMLLLFAAVQLAIRLFAHSHAAGDLHIGYYLLSFPLLQGWGMFSGPMWNVPAWSISTEFLAYLLFPLLAMAAARLCTTIVRSACALCVLLAILAAAAHSASPDGLDNVSWAFPPIRCVLEFSAGITLFYFAAKRRRHSRESWLALALAAFCYAIYLITNLPDYLLMPVGFAAIVHGLLDESTWVARWLRTWPLQWLGLVSYSTYMCHYFVKICVKLVFVRPGMPVGVPVSAYIAAVLVGSGLLYKFVERPSQRRLRRFLHSRA